MKNNRTTTIAFDVDGTLVIWDRKSGRQVPNYDIINLLRFYNKELKCRIIVWSGGGIEYARQWVDKLGISAQVMKKGAITPDIAYDDENVELGMVNINVTNADSAPVSVQHALSQGNTNGS